MYMSRFLILMKCDKLGGKCQSLFQLFSYLAIVTLYVTMSFAYQRQTSTDSNNDIFNGDESERQTNLRLWFSYLRPLKLSNRIKIGIGLALFLTLIIVLIAIASKNGKSNQSSKVASAKSLSSTQSPPSTSTSSINQSTDAPKRLNLSMTPNQLTNLEAIFDKGGIILSISSSNTSSSKLLRLNLENKKILAVSQPFKSLVSSLDFDWQQR